MGIDDESCLIGGVERREIIIADYDPAWPQQYEAYARVIRDVLGSTLLRIEHVGSTSVPGLAAKPIIDILASCQTPPMNPLTSPNSARSVTRYASVSRASSSIECCERLREKPMFMCSRQGRRRSVGASRFVIDCAAAQRTERDTRR
jgi:GrpB-like predicted nucleotidyltransferase (UPF0157 family)